MGRIVGRLVRLTGRLPDADRGRKALDVEDLLQQRPIGLPPLLIAHGRLGPLGVGLRGLGGGGAHEAEHEREGVVHLDVGQADPVQGAQLVLVLAALTGPQRRPGLGGGGGPRVGAEHRVVVAGDGRQLLAPSSPGLGALHAVVEGVEHEHDEFGLARHIRVEGHGGDPERLRDLPHRHRLQALGVGQLDRGVDHGVDGQPLARPPPAGLGHGPPEQFEEARFRGVG